jgi:hypothetical protein
VKEVDDVYIVYDGQNRLNTIFLYLDAPFAMFNGDKETGCDDRLSVLSSYPSVIKVLQSASYDDLMKYDLEDLFDKHSHLDEYNKFEGNKKEVKNMIKRIITDEFNNNDNDIFSAFLNVKLPCIIVSRGVTEDDMSKIFESINTGGVSLTKLEMLASQYAIYRYRTVQIYKNNDIVKHCTLFYDKYANANELIKINRNEIQFDDTIDMYDVLVGFQKYLEDDLKLHSVIRTPAKGEYPFLFKILNLKYENNHKKLRQLDAKDLNELLQLVESAVTVLMEIDDAVYKRNINHSSLTKPESRYHIEIPMNNAVIIVLYLINNNTNIDSFKNVLLNLCVYSELCRSIEDKTEKEEFMIHNKLKAIPSGGFLDNQYNLIKQHAYEQQCIPVQQMEKILHYILSHEREKSFYNRTRCKVPKYVMMIMTQYCANCVPVIMTETPLNIEHIIPYDLCKTNNINDMRLGNLCLLDEKLNKHRGKRPITDTFIKDNKLEYLDYTPENVYQSIVLNEEVNQELYDKECSRRETEYIRILLATMY